MNKDFSAWIGRREEVDDVLEPTRSNALTAAIGEPNTLGTGAQLPLLHHWLYFWNVRPPTELGADGHPERGGFLPAVPLPRRMWAGGRLDFLQPLHLGEQVTRTSTILKVQGKTGRSGALVFVTVQHKLCGANGLAVIEEQNIVYREAGGQQLVTKPAQEGAQPAGSWREDFTPGPVLLFRYSALTMNSHRIHYDLPYATEKEAYPALVVQGPLLATLLARLATRHLEEPVTHFEFRGVSPAFSGERLYVCGEATNEGASLWTEQAGTRNVVATATCEKLT